MRDFARDFYHSTAWKRCRETYLNKRHGLCEECLKRGLYVPADTVHHIIHLSPENIGDPNITLGDGNLYAVCRDCHAKIHAKRKRYRVDAMGKVVAIV